jgi:hypothetical protein
MTHVVGTLLLTAIAATAQFKAQPTGQPPQEVAPAINAMMNQTGTAVAGPNGVFVEIWLRNEAPSGPQSTEQGVTLTTFPIGSILGVLRFPGKGADRRGQPIPAGIYVLRYGNHPVNGDHQGVAPQRDFLVMSPAAADRTTDPVGEFEALMALSKKASGSTHPAVLSFWKGDGSGSGLEHQGETDWVLHTKIGNVPVDIILIGKAEG